MRVIWSIQFSKNLSLHRQKIIIFNRKVVASHNLLLFCIWLFVDEISLLCWLIIQIFGFSQFLIIIILVGVGVALNLINGPLCRLVGAHWPNCPRKVRLKTNGSPWIFLFILLFIKIMYVFFFIIHLVFKILFWLI